MVDWNVVPGSTRMLIHPGTCCTWWNHAHQKGIVMDNAEGQGRFLFSWVRAGNCILPVCWGGIWFRRTSPPRSCTISVDKPSVCLNHNVSLLRKRGRTENEGDGPHLYTYKLHASQSMGEKKHNRICNPPPPKQIHTSPHGQYLISSCVPRVFSLSPPVGYAVEKPKLNE